MRPEPFVEALVEALAVALLDHQRIEPHHHDLCKVCGIMNAALRKAEEAIHA